MQKVTTKIRLHIPAFESQPAILAIKIAWSSLIKLALILMPKALKVLIFSFFSPFWFHLWFLYVLQSNSCFLGIVQSLHIKTILNMIPR